MGKRTKLGRPKKDKRHGLSKPKPKHATTRKGKPKKGIPRHKRPRRRVKRNTIPAGRIAAKDRRSKTKKSFIPPYKLLDIRQPHKRRLLVQEPTQSVQSVRYSDSSSYKKDMDREDYSRTARIDENIDGLRRGAIFKQRGDDIIIEQYPN